MALTPNSVVSPQTPSRGLVRFVGTTDGTATLKALYTAGTNGSKVLGIVGVNAGATAHNVTLMIVNGGTNYQGNVVNLGTQAGNNGTVTPVALMSASVWPGLPVDSNGNPYLELNSGDTLEAEYATAQATTETISLYCVAQDY
jgi:hypothetical protein